MAGSADPALAENSAADLNFLVLPFVVGLVAALMATLALPLGPLLKSMPPEPEPYTGAPRAFGPTAIG